MVQGMVQNEVQVVQYECGAGYPYGAGWDAGWDAGWCAGRCGVVGVVQMWCSLTMLEDGMCECGSLRSSIGPHLT
jgi:hypothetical protein